MMKNPMPPDKERLFEELAIRFLSDKYGISLNDMLKSYRKDPSIDTFPVEILSKNLSGLEAIVKYLRENRKLSYIEIGKLLSRNPRTLAVTYAIARKKSHAPFKKTIEDKSVARIPFSIFNNGLSILESISIYLHSQGNSYSQIGRMLDKDPRTIWTVCSRAKLKIKK